MTVSMLETMQAQCGTRHRNPGRTDRFVKERRVERTRLAAEQRRWVEDQLAAWAGRTDEQHAERLRQAEARRAEREREIETRRAKRAREIETRRAKRAREVEERRAERQRLAEERRAARRRMVEGRRIERQRISAERRAARRVARAQLVEERRAECARLTEERRAQRAQEVQERRAERARAALRRYERQLWHPVQPRVVRLDAVMDFEAGSGNSRHEITAPLHDPSDPQTWLESELLDDLVGDLSIADIQGMTDEQLRPLRARLIEAGFAPGQGVQQKERERLRVPERHRGEAPPPRSGRMSTRHKHCKPGHRSSAGGNRPARKPRHRHRPSRQDREKVVW